uniref:SAM domain-containing protein n=1 Tax=Ascaris lumbricoides TaxID=6252 RepID=A0A9J2PA69_ASCLU
MNNLSSNARVIAQVREKDRNGGQEWNLTAKCSAIIPETIVFPDSRSYGWFADRSAEVEAFFALQPVDALEAYVDVPRRAELVAFATTANILERTSVKRVLTQYLILLVRRPTPPLRSIDQVCYQPVALNLAYLLPFNRGKLKTGIFSGNWTLRDKKEMRPSVHNITVVPVGRHKHFSANKRCSTVELVRQKVIHQNVIIFPLQSGDNFRRSAASRCSNDEVRKSSLPSEICVNRTDNYSSMNSTSRSTTRERVIPIEIKDATSDHLFTEELQATLKSRKTPLQTQVEEHRPNVPNPDSRCRPTSFPKAMFKKDSSCENILDNCHEAGFPDKRSFVSTIQEVGGNPEAEDGVDEFDEGDLRPLNEESQPCRLRRIGGVKSMGPARRCWHRPVVEVFPYAHTRSVSKDSGIPSTPVEQRRSDCSSSTEECSPTSTPIIESFATHLVIDADSAYRTGTSDSSPSSVCSNSEAQSATMRKSCPDLRHATAIVQPKNLEAHRVQNPRNRRAREKRQAAEWMKKPVNEWSFDDVLLWLQYCKLDEVASVMIGYDINGSDVDKWNDETLVQLGVVDEDVRREVLKQLFDAKEAFEKRAAEKDDKTSRGRQRMPLFKMVRSASYDKVLALETSLTTRDITVAEGRFGCLQVTKVNGANIPLREQDCLLEINEKPGQLFRSPLMFTKLVSDAEGEPIRLVVLRRRHLNDEDDDDGHTNLASGYLQGTSVTSEQGTSVTSEQWLINRLWLQDSSASSGVSSSEICSEVAVPVTPMEHSPEVLRL